MSRDTQTRGPAVAANRLPTTLATPAPRPNRRRGERTKACSPIRQKAGPIKVLDPGLMLPVPMIDGSTGWRSRFVGHLLSKRHDNTLRGVRRALERVGDLLTCEEISYVDKHGRAQPEIIIGTAGWAEVLGDMRAPNLGSVIAALVQADGRAKLATALEAASKATARQLASERKANPDWLTQRRSVATQEKAFQDALKAWQARNPEAARPHDFVNSANLHSLAVTGKAKPLFDRKTASGDELVLMLEVLRVDIGLLSRDCGYAARKARLVEVAAKERARLQAPSRLALAGGAPALDGDAP